jgi:hypothetical protein
MPELERPLAILSDVHLGRSGNGALDRSLERVVAGAAGAEIVLNGDLFDLSLDPPNADPGRSVRRLIENHPTFVRGLRDHVTSGGKLTLISGNHDAATMSPSVRSALLETLELGSDAPLTCHPWFIRRGAIHVEHGHAYDPDNAPSHPLSLWSPETEALGITLTRRFLGPFDAIVFAHAGETTPLAAVLRCFSAYRARTPLLIVEYFKIAIDICVKAGRNPELHAERARGDAKIGSVAEEFGLAREMLEELLSAITPPTHHRFDQTFMRLYFDRVIALVTLLGAGSAAIAVQSKLLLLLALAAGGYLVFSSSRGTDRYGGHVHVRLRDAARVVKELTQAEHVVFGHTHRIEREPGYSNTGSFRFGEGHPYLWVGPNAAVEPRHSPAL